MFKHLIFLSFLIPSIAFCSSSDEQTILELERKIEIALPSIRMAQQCIMRAQSLTFGDPEKSCDLCFNALKYMWNAENTLKIE